MEKVCLGKIFRGIGLYQGNCALSDCPYWEKPAANDEWASEQVLAGQYFDQETKLHYNYFRYYDPSTGRYVTHDPIGLYGGFNTYGYAYQNPLYWIDLFGLDVICEDGVVKPTDPTLLDILKKIDEKYPNKDVNVTSGTRTPEHQERLRPGTGYGTNGTKVSDHVKDRAADVKVDGVSSSDVADLARELGASGTIPYKNHTHVDTNPNRQYHPRPSALPSSQ